MVREEGRCLQRSNKSTCDEAVKSPEHLRRRDSDTAASSVGQRENRLKIKQNYEVWSKFKGNVRLLLPVKLLFKGKEKSVAETDKSY